jgi:hypothetical protein
MQQVQTRQRILVRIVFVVVFVAQALVGTTVLVNAAPGAFEASFRDLPSSVRTGDILTVQVDTAPGTTCDGTITYRGTVQTLSPVTESDRRCRWDVTVPGEARRGTADIRVSLVNGADQATIEASFDVTSRGDDVDASFRYLPGSARRGEAISIRVDVTDGASCQGTLVYDDGRPQALGLQQESHQRCRWDLTVATDAPYGPAKVRITVSQGTGQTTLSGSFDIGRKSEDAPLLVGVRDLATNVRQDGAFKIRASVPPGATCTGSVAYRGADRPLESLAASAGECVWTTQVPPDARRGVAEVSVKVQNGADTVTTTADLTVDRDGSDLDAVFKGLPDTIRRGQTLEIRVSVPDGAGCDGTLTYQDGAPQPLGAQVERKDRCLWEVDVPSNAPRGTATVRVSVTADGATTTLVSSVEVLSKEGS